MKIKGLGSKRRLIFYSKRTKEYAKFNSKELRREQERQIAEAMKRKHGHDKWKTFAVIKIWKLIMSLYLFWLREPITIRNVLRFVPSVAHDKLLEQKRKFYFDNFKYKKKCKHQ